MKARTGWTVGALRQHSWRPFSYSTHSRLAVHAQNLGAQLDGPGVFRGRRPHSGGCRSNLVNWIGNVIARLGQPCRGDGSGCLFQGRGVMRWSVTAGGCFLFSGLTRLIEFWVQNGTGGVQ